MKPIAQTVASALTEMQALSTPEPLVNIPNWAKWAEFNTCSDPQLTAMVSAMARFVLAMKENHPPRWLSLLGTSGNGKTHLAKRAWRFACKRFGWDKTGYLPEFIYWPDFVDRLRSGDAYEHFNDLKNWPVLALDDIGAERDSTGFASEKLNTINGGIAQNVANRRDGAIASLSRTLSLPRSFRAIFNRRYKRVTPVSRNANPCCFTSVFLSLHSSAHERYCSRTFGNLRCPGYSEVVQRGSKFNGRATTEPRELFASPSDNATTILFVHHAKEVHPNTTSRRVT